MYQQTVNIMKKLILAATFVFGTLMAQAQSLPTTPIKDFNGGDIAFNQTIEQGKVTIVSFWANWCIPCKKEIKAIQGKLPAWMKEADIDYITISIDDSRSMARAKSYAVSQGWEFPKYFDPNSDLKRAVNFQNVPYTIIIDKDGNVAHRSTGFEEGAEDEIYQIAKELAEK